jgi:U4/U6.U5 tri-snRNP component SNU23
MSVRRTWDKELYAQKAATRAEKKNIEEDEDDFALDLANIKKRKQELAATSKEEFQAAEPGAAGPSGSQRAFLKARVTNLSEQLEADVGKTQVVTAQAMELGVGGGFWCETCTCLLKDSLTYLSHINGKKHQRALGFSMRVENVGVDVVKDRMDALKTKLQMKQPEKNVLVASSSGLPGSKHVEASALAQHDDRLLEEEVARSALKRARKEERAEKRAKVEKEEQDEEGIDPDFASVMGFTSFGKKATK